MTINQTDMRYLISSLFDNDAAARAQAVDGALDWIDAYDAGNGMILSRALELVLDLELANVSRTESLTRSDTNEAVLHALSELAEWGLVPNDVLVRVAQRKSSETWAVEYLSYLSSLVDGSS